MSILNITNLTDNPKGWIEEKFDNAFEELESELDISISYEEQSDFIASQIERIEELAEETLGKDLLGLIDNYLVNFDYYAEVKEWYENRTEKCEGCGEDLLDNQSVAENRHSTCI